MYSLQLAKWFHIFDLRKLSVGQGPGRQVGAGRERITGETRTCDNLEGMRNTRV